MNKYEVLAAELLTAATHDGDRLSDVKLLGDAIDDIRHLRRKIGIRPNGTVRDVTFLEETAEALKAGTAQKANVRTALLDASVMVRDLCLRIQHKSQPDKMVW